MTRSALSMLCRCEQEWDPTPLPLTLVYTGVILLPAVTLFLGCVPACGRRIRPAVLSAFPFAKKPQTQPAQKGDCSAQQTPGGLSPPYPPPPHSCCTGTLLSTESSSRDSNQGDKPEGRVCWKCRFPPQISCRKAQHPRWEQCQRCGQLCR